METCKYCGKKVNLIPKGMYGGKMKYECPECNRWQLCEKDRKALDVPVSIYH
jgi:hypothetical protein